MIAVPARPMSSCAAAPPGRSRRSSQGHPVAQVSLWLRNAQARPTALPVTGDAGGYFKVDGVPAEALMFESRSLPQLQIHGIRLDANSENYVDLVLDWARSCCRGRSATRRAIPCPGRRSLSIGATASGACTASRAERQSPTAGDGAASLGSGLERAVLLPTPLAPVAQSARSLPARAGWQCSSNPLGVRARKRISGAIPGLSLLGW